MNGHGDRAEMLPIMAPGGGIAFQSTPLAHSLCSTWERKGKFSWLSSCGSTIKPMGHGRSSLVGPTDSTLREDFSSGDWEGEGLKGEHRATAQTIAIPGEHGAEAQA